MKNLMILIALLIATAAQAQEKKKVETLVIKTNAVCEMCEKTIEGNLIYEKGVKTVDLDLETTTVKVEYDPKKTSPEKIKTALTKLGYYADEMPGDEKAFRDLPACCQKEGCGGKRDAH
jgi:periplasmic mercuric ion binding protein